MDFTKAVIVYSLQIAVITIISLIYGLVNLKKGNSDTVVYIAIMVIVPFFAIIGSWITGSIKGPLFGAILGFIIAFSLCMVTDKLYAVSWIILSFFMFCIVILKKNLSFKLHENPEMTVPITYFVWCIVVEVILFFLNLVLTTARTEEYGFDPDAWLGVLPAGVYMLIVLIFIHIPSMEQFGFLLGTVLAIVAGLIFCVLEGLLAESMNYSIEDIRNEARKSNKITHYTSNNNNTNTPKKTAPKPATPKNQKSKVTLDSALAELNSMIGMKEVKDQISDLIDVLKISKERQKQGLKATDTSIHIVLTGNPGTGKTTIARILSDIFYAIGLLPEAKLIETDRSGLVAEYIGQTAVKTQEVCERAMGGVLFIDEAYTLSNGGKDDFGKEAIDTLLKTMEDKRGQFVVIVAGYQNRMDGFINSNPGLKSRFNRYIHIPDYSEKELLDLTLMFAKKEQYEFEESAKEALKKQIAYIVKNKDANFANGRTIREELCKPAFTNQSKRLKNLSDSQRANKKTLMTITKEDIPDLASKKQPGKSNGTLSYEEVMNELKSMIGMTEVKTQVQELANRIKMNKIREEKGIKSSDPAIHIVLTGNPGTGKTTIARILAKVFYCIGLLPTANLIETDRSKLIAQYIGQTAVLTQKNCDSAIGGVLFIDEAYTLANGGEKDFGKEAIDTLLKRMEDDRGKFVVIAAGYKDKMENFINANPGLKSRFTTYIHIDDYNVDELMQLVDVFAKSEGRIIADDAKPALRNQIQTIVNNKDANFANGRTIREEVFNKAITKMDNRLAKLNVDTLTEENLRTITKDDVI